MGGYMRFLAVGLWTSLGMAAGFVPDPVMAQENAVASPASDELANLKAAAEAIDPLALSADSEAAWKAYLDELEARGGPVTEQAIALNRMGDARYYQQNTQGALEASLEAKARLEKAGETGGEPMAETLANAAVFYGVTGQADRELPLQEQSLAIRRGLYGDDPKVLAPAAAKALGLGYLNYATALYERGRFAEAATYVRPSIDGLITGELRDATLFVAMSSGANILSDAGHDAEALDLAQRGVAKAAELLPDGHPFMGFAQATLAKILLQSDRFEEAEAPARLALDIMNEKLGPDHRNTMVALHNLGVISARLGRFEEALELTLARVDQLGDKNPAESVLTYETASNAAFEAGRTEKALELALQASVLADTLPDEDSRKARALVVLSLRQEEAGQYQAALANIVAAEERHRVAGTSEPMAWLDIRRGLLEIRTGQVDAGWSRVAAAASVMEDNLLADADRLELGADLPSYYESLMQIVEAAFAANRPDAALQAFELASWGVNARSRQLLSLQRRTDTAPEIAPLIEEFGQNRQRLRLLHRERARLLATSNAEDAAERQAEIETLSARTDFLRSSLADALPDFSRSLRPAKPAIADLQNRLTDEQAVLIVMPSRHRTFSMAITRDGVTMQESAQGRSRVRSLVQQIRVALESPPDVAQPFPVDAASALHALVLPDRIAQALDGRSHVALVTSDALSRLPFGVLVPAGTSGQATDYKNMDWLLKRHAFSIALTPTLAHSGEAGEISASGFLGIGAPSLSGATAPALRESLLYRGGEVSLEDIRALPALPETRAEIERVAKAFAVDQRVTLLGDEATEAKVRTALPRKQGVILFATHGLLGGEIGGLREPALVLTPPSARDSGDNDGLFQASEIAAAGMIADFVILSACNSAAGRNETAPVYTGLANAFLGSGAQSMLLSHWRVRDDAAARLSVGTVEGAASGLGRAEALQQAQLAMLNDDSRAEYAHPALWAPFVLIEN